MLLVALMGAFRDWAGVKSGQLHEDSPGIRWQQSIDAATADDRTG